MIWPTWERAVIMSEIWRANMRKLSEIEKSNIIFSIKLLLIAAIAFMLGYKAYAQDLPPGLIIDGEATATLSWTRPTKNTDGSDLPIEGIDGYVLYWGPFTGIGRCGSGPVEPLDGCYGNALNLVDGSIETTALVLQLSEPVTIYFALVAYSIDAVSVKQLSAYSNEVSREFVLEIVLPPDPDPQPEPPVLIDITLQITCTTNLADVTCIFSTQ